MRYSRAAASAAMAIAAFAGIAALPAQASPLFYSDAILTNNVDDPSEYRQERRGGLDTDVDLYFEVYTDFEPYFSFSEATATRATGPVLGLPELKAGVSGYGEVLLLGLQGYRNMGPAPLELAFAADLDWDANEPGRIGGMIAMADSSARDPSFRWQLQADFSGKRAADCGTPGTLAFAETTQDVTSGQDQGLSLDSYGSCGGDFVTLAPGEDIFIAAGLFLSSGGGFVDARHTFTTRYSSEMSAAQIGAANASLLAFSSTDVLPNPVAVPAPAGLTLFGFGCVAVGAALARRRTVKR